MESNVSIVVFPRSNSSAMISLERTSSSARSSSSASSPPTRALAPTAHTNNSGPRPRSSSRFKSTKTSPSRYPHVTQLAVSRSGTPASANANTAAFALAARAPPSSHNTVTRTRSAHLGIKSTITTASRIFASASARARARRSTRRAARAPSVANALDPYDTSHSHASLAPSSRGPRRSRGPCTIASTAVFPISSRHDPSAAASTANSCRIRRHS